MVACRGGEAVCRVEGIPRRRRAAVGETRRGRVPGRGVRTCRPSAMRCGDWFGSYDGSYGFVRWVLPARAEVQRRGLRLLAENGAVGLEAARPWSRTQRQRRRADGGW